MQQQSFNRGRMRGQFSGVKEKPKYFGTAAAEWSLWIMA